MRLKTIIRVTRAPFFLSLILSAIVGAVIAWYEGSFRLGYLLLTVLGVAAANGAMNMSNDYFDHLSGNDDVNQQLTPFSGGSRTIQEGILTAKQVLRWSLVLFAIAIAIGLYLAWARGWMILWLGIAGIFIAYFTSAPPIALNYTGHGLGELATFIGSGPLIVIGSYYVQAQRITPEAVWVSVPIGLLGAALIWINEFPDYPADKAAGKRTLVVVLGRERAVWGYGAVLIVCYAAVVVGVAIGLLPATLLLMLLTLPLAYRSIRGAARYHSDAAKLLPINATAIQLYVGNAILLCVGYVVAHLL